MLAIYHLATHLISVIDKILPQVVRALGVEIDIAEAEEHLSKNMQDKLLYTKVLRDLCPVLDQRVHQDR